MHKISITSTGNTPEDIESCAIHNTLQVLYRERLLRAKKIVKRNFCRLTCTSMYELTKSSRWISTPMISKWVETENWKDPTPRVSAVPWRKLPGRSGDVLNYTMATVNKNIHSIYLWIGSVRCHVTRNQTFLLNNAWKGFRSITFGQQAITE